MSHIAVRYTLAYARVLPTENWMFSCGKVHTLRTVGASGATKNVGLRYAPMIYADPTGP